VVIDKVGVELDSEDVVIGRINIEVGRGRHGGGKGRREGWTRRCGG
jgi:hypothetical protein